MGTFAGDRQQWVVQPLIDAGVPPDDIRDLVFDLAFVDLASEGRETAAALAGLVVDRSAAVRLAWAQTISRLLALELPA